MTSAATSWGEQWNSGGWTGTYPAAQVHGQDGLLPLLQEEDDHEGEGVRGDAALSLAVNVTQLLVANKNIEITAWIVVVKARSSAE